MGHLSLSRSFSHSSSSCPLLRASVSFMVVRFQVVLTIPPVPSVYVFVRTCVRARAAADAGVGLSKSFFHVPLCSTLLLLGRCRARTHSSSASSAFFSASCVETLARHTSMGERRVGWSQLTHRVLGPSRFLQVTNGLVLSRGSSPAQQNGCAVLCCHPLFIPVVV